jgi:hypothetical protein
MSAAGREIVGDPATHARVRVVEAVGGLDLPPNRAERIEHAEIPLLVAHLEVARMTLLTIV